MITRSSLLRLFVLILLGWSASLRAADPSRAVILVAKPGLRDALYGSTVLIAKSVGPDQQCNRFGQAPERIPERPDREIATLAALPEKVTP